MATPELDRLADAGHLHRERPIRSEFEALLRSGAARLADSRQDGLSLEGRFDLAYNAAHAIALAALRSHGYRSTKRYVVFQALVHTAGASRETVRLLDRCHRERNQAEYEGLGAVTEALVADLVTAAADLLERVRRLPLPEESSA